MDKNLLIKQQKIREKEALEEHARLAELFKTDRLAFERERKRLINEAIESYSTKEVRESSRELQKKIDKVLKGSGSPYNRLTLMHTMLWDQVHNKFIPALEVFRNIEPCWEESKKRLNKPQLRLCKK